MPWHDRKVTLPKIGWKQTQLLHPCLSDSQNCCAVLCPHEEEGCPSSMPISKGGLGPAHLAWGGEHWLDNPYLWEYLVVLWCCAALCPGTASKSGRDLLIYSKQHIKVGIRWREKHCAAMLIKAAGGPWSRVLDSGKCNQGYCSWWQLSKPPQCRSALSTLWVPLTGSYSDPETNPKPLALSSSHAISRAAKSDKQNCWVKCSLWI